MIKTEYQQLADLLDKSWTHLPCYNYFTRREGTDIVECILRMPDVNATKPLVLVYGY
jgi:hypothetical protein